MDIFVANIPFESTEAQLKQLFEMHGTVDSVKIVIDKDANRSRGFGFIRMPVDTEARSAIKGIDGTNLGSRPLAVREAEKRGGPTMGGSRGQPSGGRQYREDDGNRRNRY